MTIIGGTGELAGVESLRTHVRGAIHQPGDPGYDEARAVFNAARDLRPAAVVRAAGVADVRATVAFAAEHGLELAVRGGGHSIAGFSTTDGGVVLDLGGMRGIRVDPEGGTVRAEGGCTWGDLDHATGAFGLATPGGIVSTTGIAGLTLGGGMGHLTRRFGLSCDNLVAADVVTADGRFVPCDAEREPDLFWALRGGGGNLGVVTSFVYRAHPVHDVLAGPVVYPLDAAVARAWRELIAGAPDELGALLVVGAAPPLPTVPAALHGRPAFIVLACWSGPPERDEEILGLLTSLGPVAGHAVGRIPYPALNRLLDELQPRGRYHDWHGRFAPALTDEAIDVHAEFGARLPSPETATIVFPIDGACARVAAGATAFAWRDGGISTAFGPTCSDRESLERGIEWGSAYEAALAPASAGSGYVNFAGPQDRARVRADYGPNYERLLALKRRYDPGNLLRRNHNVRP